MSNREDILEEFAMEDAMTHATLKSYITRYPELASELTELFSELSLSDLEAELASSPIETKAVNTAVFRSQKVESALFDSGVRDLARELALPRSFFMGLQANIVRIGSLPGPLLKNLAEKIGVKTQDVILGMQRGGDQSFALKSEAKPFAEAPVEFAEYVEQASLTPEQLRALEDLMTVDGPH